MNLLVALLLVALVGLLWSIYGQRVRWLLNTLRWWLPEMPSTIHLIEVSEPRWHYARRVKAYAEQLRAAGFSPIAVYRVPELRGLLRWAFQRESDGVVALIVDLPGEGCFLELQLLYSESAGATVSNNHLLEGTSENPKHPLRVMADAGLEALVERLQALSDARTPQRFDRTSYPAFVEAAYRWEMKALSDRGGISDAELLRMEEGQTPDPQAVARMGAGLRQSHFERLRRECIARYCQQAQVSVAEYEDWRGALLVVADGDNIALLSDALDEVIALTREQHARLAQLPYRKVGAAPAFNAQVGEIIPGIACLGRVREPTNATLYLLPEAAP